MRRVGRGQGCAVLAAYAKMMKMEKASCPELTAMTVGRESQAPATSALAAQVSRELFAGARRSLTARRLSPLVESIGAAMLEADAPDAAAPMQPVDLSEVPTSDALAAKDDVTPKGPQSGTDPGDEEAAMLMSGVKVELINWQAMARPAESALVGIVILLLALALFGHDWLSGASDRGHMIVAGLGGASEARSPPVDLQAMCEQAVGNATSVSCALAAAGGGAASCLWLAFIAALLLAAAFITEELGRRGLLAAVAAKLPAEIPLDKLSSYLPAVCWSLVLLFDLLALLVYSFRSPSSLGGGYVRYGTSFGCGRLSLVVALAALLTELSLVHKLGEDQMVATLDALRGHWSALIRRQQATQLLLVSALICELLLWVERAEWGALLIAYGLWAYTHHNHDHLGVFCVAALFSTATDAIALAACITAGGLMHVLTWILVLCKLLAVAMLVYYKDAFA